MQAMNMERPEALFSKADIESFVPLKAPILKVKIHQKQRKKENIRSMLRTYCSSKFRSSSPQESSQMTTTLTRPTINTRLSNIPVSDEMQPSFLMPRAILPLHNSLVAEAQ